MARYAKMCHTVNGINSCLLKINKRKRGFTIAHCVFINSIIFNEKGSQRTLTINIRQNCLIRPFYPLEPIASSLESACFLLPTPLPLPAFYPKFIIRKTRRPKTQPKTPKNTPETACEISHFWGKITFTIFYLPIFINWIKNGYASKKTTFWTT